MHSEHKQSALVQNLRAVAVPLPHDTRSPRDPATSSPGRYKLPQRSACYASAKRALSLAALSVAALALAGCGSTYRPVVSSINPVGPAAQPTKYAVAISSTGATTRGLVSIIDFAGDTILDTTAIGIDPKYLAVDPNGSTAYTLNGDGTLNSFGISTNLRSSDVLQSTLLPGSNPLSIYAQGTNLYIAQTGRNSIAQLQGTPPAIQQELPTGPGTVYTVGSNNAPRAYTLVQSATAGLGKVVPIETASNTTDTAITVGKSPVYGVMTADARRAFILNQGSNTVSVINVQTNALDTFSDPTTGVATGTIPVGIAPVWAEFAPTLSEVVVANAGDGLSPGSLSVISIPLCSATSVTSNPNCDRNNPVDAVGFGQVLANIPVGINPVMVAVLQLQDGIRAYVANAGNAALSIPGSISVVNLTTNVVIATIPAANSINPLDAVVHGHPAFIAATTGAPTGKVYVTALDSSDVTIIRTDTDLVQTHLSLQGTGIQVRVTAP